MSSLDTESPPLWYCLHTRSRHEEMVFQRLEDKRIFSFLPKLEVWSRRKDRRKKIQKALFPGYIFVREVLDPLHRLEILKTPGVVKILDAGATEDGCPYVVTEFGIADLHGRSTWERAERVIEIAHPQFRDDLIREAQKMKIWRPSNKL